MSFKCMMKGDKFNQPMHTAGHILSPSNCTHLSPSIMKSPSKDSQYHIVPLDSFYHDAKMSKSIAVLRLEPQTMKISHYIFPSKLYY